MYRFLKDSVMPALVLPFESLANWRGDGISPGFDKSDFERACDASVGAAVAVGDKQAFTICNNVIEPAPYGIVVFNDRYVVVVGCAEHDEDRLLGHINDRGRAKLLGQLDLSASGKLAVIDPGCAGAELDGADESKLYVRAMAPGVYNVRHYEIIDQYSFLIIDQV
ncbi:MAG: hypothetical protein H6708_34420 [Kofleriaceae bacterium]|nr:hypothetical protein [Kofleriaceae bacterium]